MEKTSKAIEDYLEALLMLEESGSFLNVTSLASQLKVSLPASSQMAGELKNLGYIEKQPYGDITLTPSGRDIATKIYHRHKVLSKYLISLGVAPKTAEEDCCKIEHVISKETFDAIEKQLLKNQK
jgi:DtxR family transcriptional regulator, Mn-dependent transcriptional regulator